MPTTGIFERSAHWTSTPSFSALVSGEAGHLPLLSGST
jgi:hypothetical protein